jgi:hypothetical protein
MQVLPHIMVASRLVVLAKRRALAPIGNPHRNGSAPSGDLDLCWQLIGDVEDVFEVLIRYEDDMAAAQFGCPAVLSSLAADLAAGPGVGNELHLPARTSPSPATPVGSAA